MEFNRALLANGFWMLEALELNREYEVGLLLPAVPGGWGRWIQVADPLALLAMRRRGDRRQRRTGDVATAAVAGVEHRRDLRKHLSPRWEEGGSGV